MSDEPLDKPSLRAPLLSLFASVSTLVCCALPALLVTLGAGAALASIVSSAPWLVALSKYKVITFSAAGVMLLVAGIFWWRGRYAPCPADPALAATCARLRKFQVWIYWISVAIYLVGFFFAFLAADIFYG